MRLVFTNLLLFFINSAFSQESRQGISESKIYLRATYFDQKNDILGLQVRTDLSDTIIEGRRFLKFKTEDFVDYSEIEKTDIYYESFSNGNYLKLDNYFRVVHNLNFNVSEDQSATLFGEKLMVSLEFIDTRKSFPRDSLTPTEKTPRKYFNTDNSEIYAVIIPDLQTLAVSSNGQFYTKQLIGDNYNDISEGIKNNSQVSNQFNIEKGDEIQLFYRRKWYNDSTGLAEYVDKQYKNIKYIDDTIIEGEKSLRLQVEGYSYLSGSTEGPTEFLIQVTDSGYFNGKQFIPFKSYNTDLKIIEQNGNKSFFLQGVSVDTINGFAYQKIIQATPDPYRNFILPFFPMTFIEFGNVQGVITYAKINGIEKGVKKERTYITNENNVRDIYSISNNKVKLEMYLLEPFDVEIEVKDINKDKLLGSFVFKSHEGVNAFILKTKKLEKGNYYRVQINYKKENGSGSFSNGFTSKH